ncbi:unnamed protein product [Amoebophrya sp. A25]|nr:unnamed protein product [Amoebophrya sp. A25]|eukprot:GSA25T00009822001.1
MWMIRHQDSHIIRGVGRLLCEVMALGEEEKSNIRDEEMKVAVAAKDRDIGRGNEEADPAHTQASISPNIKPDVLAAWVTELLARIPPTRRCGTSLRYLATHALCLKELDSAKQALHFSHGEDHPVDFRSDIIQAELQRVLTVELSKGWYYVDEPTQRARAAAEQGKDADESPNYLNKSDERTTSTTSTSAGADTSSTTTGTREIKTPLTARQFFEHLVAYSADPKITAETLAHHTDAADRSYLLCAAFCAAQPGCRAFDIEGEIDSRSPPPDSVSESSSQHIDPPSPISRSRDSPELLTAPSNCRLLSASRDFESAGGGKQMEIDIDVPSGASPSRRSILSRKVGLSKSSITAKVSTGSFRRASELEIDLVAWPSLF